MVNKRPPGNDESYTLPSKHPRQLECINQLDSVFANFPCNDAPQKSHTSGEGDFNKSEGEETPVSGNITELAIGLSKEFETRALGGISSLPGVTRSTSDEASKSEAAVNLSFLPEFFESAQLTRTLCQHEEICRKVGPDHQADVPVWGLHGIKNTTVYRDMSDPQVAFPLSTNSNQMADDDDMKKLMGTCVIPMPDSDVSVYNGNKIGSGTTDCSCQDRGSVRCVRQHIVEEREKLIRTLGQEKFMELGFCDMGEEVARKWNEEEEEAFQEVVFSNPTSLGRNFWDHLSVVFPSRTKKELVSYYFNVFMLRKRAEQNRLHPLNIDSDNDEWQDSDDGDYECGTTEEDEDSVVESPVDQDDPAYDCEEHEDRELSSDNNDDGNVVDDGGLTREGGWNVDCVSEAQTRKSRNGCSFDPKFDLFGNNPQKYGENHDFQDDSCTSYECQPSKADSCGPEVVVDATHGCRVECDHNNGLQGSYSGSSNGVGHGHEMEPCDAKAWDVGYHMGPKTDVDLLSTCNMIKEVFGEEAWSNKGRDDKGTS